MNVRPEDWQTDSLVLLVVSAHRAVKLSEQQSIKMTIQFAVKKQIRGKFPQPTGHWTTSAANSHFDQQVYFCQFLKSIVAIHLLRQCEFKRSVPLNFKPVAVLSCRNAPDFGLQGFFWLQWRKQTADSLLDERRKVCRRTGRTH